MSNPKNHKTFAQAHAKQRMEQRYKVDFNKDMRKRALWEIKLGKSIMLDARCSTNPANRLHWVNLDKRWYLLVYSISMQTIVTALPTRSKYPYSPFSLKKLHSEMMWNEYEKQKAAAKTPNLETLDELNKFVEESVNRKLPKELIEDIANSPEQEEKTEE